MHISFHNVTARRISHRTRLCNCLQLNIYAKGWLEFCNVRSSDFYAVDILVVEICGFCQNFNE